MSRCAVARVKAGVRNEGNIPRTSHLYKTLVLNKNRLSAEIGKVTLANKHLVHILQLRSQNLKKDTGQVLTQEWR